METLPGFKLVQPATVVEAVAAWAENTDARFVAGGTDLLVNMRRGIVDAAALIDLSDIPEMKEISQNSSGWTIGAGVTLSQLAKNQALKASFPVVYQAALAVAGPTHRVVASVGGNLCLDTRCIFYNQSEWWREANNYCLKNEGTTCHTAPSGEICYAAFSGDLAPALIACDAQVTLVGPSGERDIPLLDMYQNDGRDHLLLEEGEVLAKVTLPDPALDARSAYEKVRVRGSLDFPLAGIAIVLAQQDDLLTHLRIALTGINSQPVSVKGTDELLGLKFDEDGLEKLAKLLPKQIKPMPSTFYSPQYRRRAVTNVTLRLAKKLYENS
jgi:4-hydroxybenzoyl-CoA reductase subunit beta